MDATRARSPSIGILRLNSPTKLNSKKRLPCLGLIEYRLGARNFCKALSSQGIREVLHRPFEPARLTGTFTTISGRIGDFTAECAPPYCWSSSLQSSVLQHRLRVGRGPSPGFVCASFLLKRKETLARLTQILRRIAPGESNSWLQPKCRVAEL